MDYYCLFPQYYKPFAEDLASHEALDLDNTPDFYPRLASFSKCFHVLLEIVEIFGADDVFLVDESFLYDYSISSSSDKAFDVFLDGTLVLINDLRPSFVKYVPRYHMVNHNFFGNKLFEDKTFKGKYHLFYHPEPD